MIPRAENPAAIDPRHNLTPAQREALLSIGFYRQQSRTGATITIGRKRFSLSTVASLIDKKLVRGHTPNLTLTTGGELAIKRLQGGQ